MSEQLPAVTHEVQAWRAYKRAYELERASLELSFLTHIPEPTLDAAKNQQRQAIFNIALKLLNAERDKSMDIAVAHWLKYRTMRPPADV